MHVRSCVKDLGSMVACVCADEIRFDVSSRHVLSNGITFNETDDITDRDDGNKSFNE